MCRCCRVDRLLLERTSSASTAAGWVRHTACLTGTKHAKRAGFRNELTSHLYRSRHTGDRRSDGESPLWCWPLASLLFRRQRLGGRSDAAFMRVLQSRPGKGRKGHECSHRCPRWRSSNVEMAGCRARTATHRPGTVGSWTRWRDDPVDGQRDRAGKGRLTRRW